MDEDEEEMDGGAFALALGLWDFGTFRDLIDVLDNMHI